MLISKITKHITSGSSRPISAAFHLWLMPQASRRSNGRLTQNVICERKQYLKSNHFKLFTLFAALCLPTVCYANGGGPLLLFISFFAFIYGQVWILASETFVYIKLLKLSLRTAFKQVFIVNLVSTIVVGLGLPFLLAVITGLGMELPEPYGGYFSIVGTWVYESAPHIALLPYTSAFWLLITLFLTVLCERWVLLRIWAKTNYTPPVPVNSLMWRAHLVSYSGLFVIILYFWLDML